MEGKCPTCKNIVPTHFKEWVTTGLKGVKLHIYMFSCPYCGNRFRKVVKEGKKGSE